MSGTLYLVATPIGNLGDLSPRGVQTLQEADFIAAEDTRVSMKLLNHFDIKKPLVSYHEHNRAAAGQAILARLLEGETCALVTDAGTPAISDPGQDLVALCAANGVTVHAVRLWSAIKDCPTWAVSPFWNCCSGPSWPFTCSCFRKNPTPAPTCSPTG